MNQVAFNPVDLRTLALFFNNGGYVMDFSTTEFDNFTESVMGIPIVTKYQTSKAKSLNQFFSEANDQEALQLLSALLEYFEQTYRKTERPQDQDNIQRMENYYESAVQISHSQNYAPSKELLSKSSLHTKGLDHQFVRDRLQELEEKMDNNSASSIGASKDLLESVMKSILDDAHVSYTNEKGKTDDIPALWGKVQTELGLKPKDMPDTPIGKSSKEILSSLSKIVIGMDKLRNQYGTGHGRNASFKPLPVRYGKLTAAATITLIEFLLDTDESRHFD